MGEQKKQLRGRVCPTGLVGLREKEGVRLNGSKEGSTFGEGCGVVGREDGDGERRGERRRRLQGEPGW